MRRLVTDAFALHKGHRYATVVMDAATMRVLWVGEGRNREANRPFFALLGEAGCRRFETVAMAMNTAFDLTVRQHCPQAEVVYDLFHVVARCGREVIDRVRVKQANALRNQPAARQVIKRMAYGFRDSAYFFLKIKDAFPRKGAMNPKTAPGVV
ncbi:MAG: hypothetical protein Kow0096_11530 [Thiohalomonadaceae bacterium]